LRCCYCKQSCAKKHQHQTKKEEKKGRLFQDLVIGKKGQKKWDNGHWTMAK
jgi:hypothetical protein